MSERKITKGSDGLLYDEDGYVVYNGPSPLSEDEGNDVEED